MPIPYRLLVALLAVPRLAAAATVTRGPFLQQTGPSSTIVVVRTSEPAAVDVEADLPGGGTARAHGDAATDHALAIAGLPPASAVPYRVLVDGAAASAGTIRTPAVPGTAQARHAVLGVLGDYGTQGPVEHGNVARLVDEKVEALLTVGDNAYPDGAASDFDPAVFGPLAPLLRQATFWPALGDHEYRTAWAQPYLDAFVLPAGPQGERYYAFDWGDLHAEVLDSNCVVPLDAATAGCDAATMTAWMRDDLARTKAPWKIVLIHRPALATGKYGVYPEIPAALVPVFQDLGVDLVLQGHNHLYERSWPTRDGVPVQRGYDHAGAPVYVTSGGGGDWLYDFALPPADWTAYREKTAQHLVLTLDGGTLRVDSIRPDGSTCDRFEIVKDVPPPAEGAGVEPGIAPIVTGCGSGGDAGIAVLAFVPGLLVLRRRRRA